MDVCIFVAVDNLDDVVAAIVIADVFQAAGLGHNEIIWLRSQAFCF